MDGLMEKLEEMVTQGQSEVMRRRRAADEMAGVVMGIRQVEAVIQQHLDHAEEIQAQEDAAAREQDDIPVLECNSHLTFDELAEDLHIGVRELLRRAIEEPDTVPHSAAGYDLERGLERVMATLGIAVGRSPATMNPPLTFDEVADRVGERNHDALVAIAESDKSTDWTREPTLDDLPHLDPDGEPGEKSAAETDEDYERATGCPAYGDHGPDNAGRQI